MTDISNMPAGLKLDSELERPDDVFELWENCGTLTSLIINMASALLTNTVENHLFYAVYGGEEHVYVIKVQYREWLQTMWDIFL